ncbi:MAG: FtsX-like permease family protein [Candidatus Bathyarchaeota archaeon]|nr:FtsX-like permease family protein [Candidatus Bathyarchaeota archaeon]
MRVKYLILVLFLAAILSYSLTPPYIVHCISYQPIEAKISPSINIKAIDAITGNAVRNVTIILWDIANWVTHRYFTDENGECIISGDHIRLRGTYWLYAFKGDFNAKLIDYVPVKAIINFERIEVKNITLTLLPGALIEIEGIPYIAQTPSMERRRMSIRVVVETKPFNYSFINEYVSSLDVHFLGLPDNIVIAPANFPFFLEVEVSYIRREFSRISFEKEKFRIYNGSLPFRAPHKGVLPPIKISAYSLRSGVEYTKMLFTDISRMIDRVQAIGFTVFDERKMLSHVSKNMVEAEILLQNAQKDEDFREVWLTLRKAIDETDNIHRLLRDKLFFAESQAVYLPAVISVFSIAVSFFFFEDERKKIVSNIIFYILFLAVLYYTHPGTHIIIIRNAVLFICAAIVSFTAFSFLVFILPRVWKERSVEGEVTWRSAIVLLFSMGKRQIKRKKIRGFFTIFSVGILILAFVSLTSFGTVFGVISERVGFTSLSEGILVRRMVNGSSAFFSPLGYSDIITISEIIPMVNVAQRWRNLPRADPIALLINPKTNENQPIYGVIAISPSIEANYTGIEEIIDGGEYLSDDAYGEILISSSLANKLNIKEKSNVTLRITDRLTENLSVKGLINDEKYDVLKDVDGSLFGPYRLLEDGSTRRCNSTEVILINLKTLEKILDKAPNLILLSEIVFQPASITNIEANIKNVVLIYGHDVFVSLNGVVTYYHIGSYIELKGVLELLIPIIMVVLNVSMVMINSAYEREKEIRVLSAIGLNPTHIGLTFVAEAAVIGMVGGSLGYLAGLSFYRIMMFFGHDLMVREKLEWWWSALGFALAILISVLSAMRPAAMAVSAYTPSKIKRVKRPEEEEKKRREEIFRVYQTRELSMPIKVLINEKEFFIGYFLSCLGDLRYGYVEKVENIEDLPEIESTKGEITKTIKFTYLFGPPENKRGTNNALTLVKRADEEYYRVKLISEPISPGMPESALERTVDFVHEILMRWIKDKRRIMGLV